MLQNRVCNQHYENERIRELSAAGTCLQHENAALGGLWLLWDGDRRAQHEVYLWPEEGARQALKSETPQIPGSASPLLEAGSSRISAFMPVSRVSTGADIGVQLSGRQQMALPHQMPTRTQGTNEAACLLMHLVRAAAALQHVPLDQLGRPVSFLACPLCPLAPLSVVRLREEGCTKKRSPQGRQQRRH